MKIKSLFISIALLAISCADNSQEQETTSQTNVDNQSEKQKTDMWDAETVCFYMYYPSGGKRVMIEEYILLWVEGNQLRGFGAGRSEGDDDWRFHFKGSFLNGTKANISAVYTQVGNEPLTLDEVWNIDLKKHTLELDSKLPTDLRIFGDGKFHRIDCQNISNWAKILLSKEVK